MELRHLRYFLAIDRYGTMTKAAEALHISQPSLSAQIKQLEEELGIQLFERAQGLKLTEAGEILKKYAVSVLKQLKDCRTELDDLKHINKGKVVVGSLPTVMVTWLPAMIKSFKEKYPGIDIEIHDMDTQQLKKELAEGNIDVGIITHPVDESQYYSIPLLKEELFLIVPVNHHLSGKEQVDMCVLSEEPFVLYGAATQSRYTIIEACKKAGFFPRISHESDKVEIVISFVSSGLGIAFVPRGSLEFRINRDVSVLKVNNPKPYRTICLAFNNKRYISHAMKAFGDHLSQYFTKQESWKNMTQNNVTNYK